MSRVRRFLWQIGRVLQDPQRCRRTRACVFNRGHDGVCKDMNRMGRP